MTKQEINDGNNLIAEFMGEETTHDYRWQSTHNNFKYHTSWDLLFPVMEKICECGCSFELMKAIGSGCKICKIGNRHEEIKIFHEQSDNLIEATWNNAIKFIKFWNENYKHL